ncbi:MAG: hypothetical protein ACFFA0_03985 [Promethearchaeota archaeon]
MTVEKEPKIKIVRCTVCGKEYNKYTRPMTYISQMGYQRTCSEECKMKLLENSLEIKKKRQKSRKQSVQVWLIFSLITGIIGAVIGGMIGSATWILIGFAIGFFVPTLLAMGCG